MTTQKGIWNLQQVRDKQLQDLWDYAGRDPDQLYIWGPNQFGQLGLNQAESVKVSSPTQITGTWDKLFPISGANAPSKAGSKTSGSLWVWGYNNQGQLGQNSKTYYSSPVQIPGTTWNKVFVGDQYVNGIKTDGTMWSWGINSSGQLGQNTSITQSSPVQIPSKSGTTWTQTLASDEGSMAINSANELYAWGGWYYGSPVLTGREVDHSSPVQVPGTTWRTASYSFGNGVLTKTDGTLWTFGANNGGQLGINEQGAWPAMTTSRSSPVQVPGTNWTNGFGTGMGNSFGIKTDGTLWSWGYNTQGQLGLNNRTNYSSPVQVGSDTTWSGAYMKFGAGRSVSAIKTDGTLWQWGRGNVDNGAIGNNTALYYSSPTQIGSLTNWSATTGGGWFVNTLSLTGS